MRIPLIVVLLTAPLLAGDPVPLKEGDKNRTEILSVVRDPIEDALHQEVSFKINHLVMQDGWAFLDAVPLTKDGKAMNYKGTMFEEWVDEADEVLWILLRNKGERWYIVEKVFFTTDATWVEWPRYFRAPQGIFPKLKLE